ncbi:MAG TPA: adenosylcobinamide-GDP ribazoletransferase [Propylenella sp.]|jgi:adenosylcobinamide-GDP ribazoletransferase
MDEFAARLSRLPKDTLTALSFFSRIPVGEPSGALDLRQAASAWPLAGLLLALGPALILLLATAADFASTISAIFAIALYAALTGALHEDGLADTADGFGGGRTREEKLEIMRDSRLGTFGAVVLFLVLALKVIGLGIISLQSGLGALALLMAAVVSRALALWHWNGSLPARRDGAGWAAGRPDWAALAVGLATGLVAALIILIFFGVAGLIGLLMAAAGVGLFTNLANRQIGGYTGDTVGAAQQIAEALLLAGLSIGWTTIII